MSRLGRFASALLGFTLIGLATANGQGNCQNDTQYPSGAITPDAGGAVTTISTCNFEAEYSQVTGILAGVT